MGRWKQTIKIKEFLSSGTDADGIKAAAAGIISRLPGDAPTAKLSKAAGMADDDAETALLVFNAGMDSLYDWADANRVWLA